MLSSKHEAHVPRLFPLRALPPHTYIPGRTTKLLASQYATRVAERAVDWRDTVAFRWGCELFNHGYYWESHEVWEGLWHALGRTGRDADFIKGLIKLAAAGVKVREGLPTGVARHLQRARELLHSAQREIPVGRQAGIELSALLRFIEESLSQPPRTPEHDRVVRVWYYRLLVDDPSGRIVQ